MKRARSELGEGEGRKRCRDCDEPIPEPRRCAIPGVLRCVACQEEHDDNAGPAAGINRRGSKDSQLR